MKRAIPIQLPRWMSATPHLSFTRKVLIAGTATAFSGLMYLTTNHVHLTEPVLLTMSSWDWDMPLVPWTLWIYLSAWPFVIFAFLWTKDAQNMDRTLYAYVLMNFISGLFFAFLPTTYPRELFPIAGVPMDFLTRLAFQIFREADTPANCLPSLHVSSAYMGALVTLRERHRPRGQLIFWGGFVWATLIALSTMTTKQHYFVDALSGGAVAFLCYGLFHSRLFKI